MLSDPKREAEIEFEIKVAKEPWRKILLDAAEVLRTKGWCRIMLEDLQGRHCAMGAINAVEVEDEPYAMGWKHYEKALNKLRQFAFEQCGVPSVGVWNDRLGNTGEKVIDAMEALARA